MHDSICTLMPLTYSMQSTFSVENSVNTSGTFTHLVPVIVQIRNIWMRSMQAYVSKIYSDFGRLYAMNYLTECRM